jgi:ammonium transporter, Amt family
VVVFAYSAIVSFILLKRVGLVLPLRADKASEGIGLDIELHREEAYSRGEGAVLLRESDINGS